MNALQIYRNCCVATLVFLGLIGCQQDLPTLVVPDTNPQSPSTERALHLSVSTPNSVELRAGGADPMLEVSRLLLLFYDDGSDAKLQRIREVEIGSSDQLTDVKVLLPPANYKLIAIANPSPKLRELAQQGSALSLFTTPNALATYELMDRVGEGAPKSFPLINEQGAVSIPSTNFDLNAESVSLKLEPMIARVLVYGTPQLRGMTKGIARAQYILGGTQSKSYLLRQLASLQDGQQETAGDNSPRAKRYARTPIWEVWGGQAPSTTEGINSLELRHYYETPAMWVGMEDSRDAFTAEKLRQGSLYSREATMPEQAFLEGTTPYVVLAYPCIPEGLTLSGESGWVSYRGRNYTEAQVKGLLQSGMPEQEDLKVLKQALTDAHITAQSFSRGFEQGGIRFYYKGYSYYTIYIRHFGQGIGSGPTYGRYGVVRGNEYRIHVKSIMDVGSPTPPLLSGRLSPLVEQQRGALSLEISPLVEREQEVVGL